MNKIMNDNYYLFRIYNIDFKVDEKYYEVVEIITDIDWMSSILNNLLTNSIKAYERNLKSSSSVINLEINTQKTNIIFTLSDQAGGLDDQYIKKINEPSVFIVKQGRVGLNLVKKYTSLLQGVITCENIVNVGGTKGAKFTLTFPLKIKYDGE